MYNFCILDVWMDNINTDVLGHYIIIAKNEVFRIIVMQQYFYCPIIDVTKQLF